MLALPSSTTFAIRSTSVLCGFEVSPVKWSPALWYRWIACLRNAVVYREKS